MNKSDLQMTSFQMISIVGEAKSKFVEAINAAEEFNIELAENLIAEGTALLGQAGKLHLPIVTHEAQGNDLTFSVIFMHAEDQYLTTDLFKTIAQKFVNVYKKGVN